MDGLFIEDIIGKLKRGELRIPAFQRGFVWSPDDVAFLMDSIYKSYPFGTIVLWRTKTKLNQERDLGPFKVPEPTADYPIDYVLDGQQRITSILGVFATDLPRSNTIEWRDIYFDLSAPEDMQGSQFVALKSEDVKENHFPLNVIFDSVEYRIKTNTLQLQDQKKLDELQKIFQKAQLPVYKVETSETDKNDKIAIVFERINRKGVPLDTFQLLSAWTWNEDFELKQQFEELSAELEKFGFSDIGQDADLILRCAAAVLLDKESAESLLDIKGDKVRNDLPRIKKGIRAAIDFLKSDMNVQKLANLPYPTALIPLTSYFAGPETEQHAPSQNQHKILADWFWRACFSHRYSSGTKRNLEQDIKEAKRLRINGTSSLGSFDVAVTASTFAERRFLTSSVDTKMFVLMLANQKPKSLVSGSFVAIGDVLAAGNRSEFHHLFPQSFLKSIGVDSSKANCLANFCIISAADNKKIGGKQPSIYKTKLHSNIEQILNCHIIPLSLFDDDFDRFISERSNMLVSAANTLMGK